jgi:hypothetical protein
MAGGPVLVPLAVCEECWLIDHSHWQPESMDENGNITMRLLGVDVPEAVVTGSVEICCECGGITVCGIYALKDPSAVYFSRSDEPPQFELGLQDYGEDFL